MKPHFPIALLLAALPLAAQTTALDKSKADLSKARQELDSTSKEYVSLRSALYREINRLDDEAIALGKELRALEKEKETRIARQRSLDRTIDARKTEFEYASGVLNQYGKALATRLHPAENQRTLAAIEEAEQKAAAAREDHAGELAERARVAKLGIERLSDMAGGFSFDGKALRNGSEALDGKFLLLGPAVFFKANNGGFEGVASFTATGTGLPTVVGIDGVGSGLIAGTLDQNKGELPFDGSMGKALEVQAAQESLGETIEKGGIVGHCILGLGAIALALTIFKAFEITRFPVPSRKQINLILDDLINDNRSAAAQKAAALPGMAGDLVRTGVERFHEKRRVLEEALFEKMVNIKPRLDRFLPFLGLTAAAAPLMGLLGTVLGIIKTFQAMAIYGTGNAKNFSAGISEALITTAEGLVVAIPVLVLHGIMKSLAKAKFGEVEGIAIALMNGTTEVDRKAGRTTGEDDDDFALSPTPA
jgi:biopolymer transport protein ExbB